MKGASPLDRLNQGFSYVQREDGRTVRRVADVREKELLNIYVTDGVIHAQVRDVRKED